MNYLIMVTLTQGSVNRFEVQNLTDEMKMLQ